MKLSNLLLTVLQVTSCQGLPRSPRQPEAQSTAATSAQHRRAPVAQPDPTPDASVNRAALEDRFLVPLPVATVKLLPRRRVLEDRFKLPLPIGTAKLDIGGRRAVDSRFNVPLPVGTAKLNIGGRSLTAEVQVITSDVQSGTAQILPSPTKRPDTTGRIVTELETGGRSSIQPLLTSSIEKPASLIQITASARPTPSPPKANMVSADIFADPIATTAPPSNIAKRTDHPVPRLGIVQTGVKPTNKFYANKFLGSQSSPSFLHPYSVAWAKGAGASASWGMAISHIEAQQRVYGPTNAETGAASYFINPVGIQSVVLSAQELGSNTVLTTDRLLAHSARVSLRPDASSRPAIQFPLVQGSAFVTGIYAGSTPLIQTGVFFRTVTRSTQQVKQGITKYKLVLEDNTTWLLYAYNTSGNALDLQVINNGLAQASEPFNGLIQVAKDPGGAETTYDQACGVYTTGLVLSGSADGTKGTYTFTYAKAGMTNTTLLMFALPHHLESFDDDSCRGVTQVQLQTTTKGVATAVFADHWNLVEQSMPVGMGFAPWSPKLGSLTTLSSNASAFIRSIAVQEISQNMAQQANQNSMYFSGKALAKFASILIVTNDILGDTALAQSGLAKLKDAFAIFANQAQQYPLVYESAWGGVVSVASYVTNDAGADFGNTYYNDHHFHYGYHIFAAAAIAHLDPSWIDANKDYVNTLVRDVANPSQQDSFFPVSRNFDWFNGHSWAHGLYETLDGKDQESSSEDTMHAYAVKMWGTVIGDGNMAARGNLMLSIMARSMQKYYLYTKDNIVQPANFIGNKVAGILFENKIDHTTYFGNNIEYIQGIHMIPLLPCSPLVRSQQFVAEEWATYFDQGRVDSVAGGWKGILMGNYATIDPKTAYQFFSAAGFDPSWLDGGASLTWYLAYAAALGGL